MPRKRLTDPKTGTLLEPRYYIAINGQKIAEFRNLTGAEHFGKQLIVDYSIHEKLGDGNIMTVGGRRMGPQ
jgi:hypothetical protein